MNKFLLALALVCASLSLSAQNSGLFQAEIDPNFLADEVIVAPSPLYYQVLFIGSTDEVQTTATYGNPAGSTVAKEWHDFIGFTPDETGESLGWVTVNHEMIIPNDNIGDGGGMTAFRVERDPETDTLIIVEQTLDDGRQGKFFNVDFVNFTGETGMNCGGITSAADGRIWTAEEWFRGSNQSIADRDTSDFIIGQGTVNGQAAPAGFPGFDGEQIAKYQNYNYMTEIDPRQARAVRKQYNWGRQPFEGGVVLPDNKTVYTGGDATPGFFTKFVADEAGDFTSGTTYVYKHDAPEKWIEIDNSDLNKMLNFSDEAVAVGATMFNRIEWVAYDQVSGNVYFTETGRDNPGSRWAGEFADGAVFPQYHLDRAADQGVADPTDGDYWDYYGRIIEFDPTTDEVSVFLEAGPYFEESPTISNYGKNHLSNPDGLNVLTVDGESYMLICEDLNGTSFGRVPAGVSTRTCEFYVLDMSIENPTIDDLVRIAITPFGSEVTGAVATPDGKTVLINSQHPSSANPFPYNHSLTFALTGWDKLLTTTSLTPEFTEEDTFQVFPNPAARMVFFNQATDVALYDMNGQRMQVYRNVNQIDISAMPAGTYFLQTAEGVVKKLVIQK
jgi:secreted PhoX family phosphatase